MNIKMCLAKVEIGFAISSIVRLQALGKFGSGFAKDAQDLSWAAPIWSISVSLLCAHSLHVRDWRFAPNPDVRCRGSYRGIADVT